MWFVHVFNNGENEEFPQQNNVNKDTHKLLKAAYFRNVLAVVSIIMQAITLLILVHKL